MANKPEIAKMSNAGVEIAAPSNSGTAPMPPPMVARMGKAISSSRSPAVVWRMAMPIR